MSMSRQSAIDPLVRTRVTSFNETARESANEAAQRLALLQRG